MRRTFRVLLVGASLGLPFPVAAEPANTAAGQRSLLRREKSLDKKCSGDARVDCTATSEAHGSSLDTTAKQPVIDACTTFNATMSTFCDMVGDYEPDSPEMLSATAKVIAAKKELLKQLSLVPPAKRS